MQKEKCSHSWEMIDVSSGLIVMKKCFHCSKISTCFIFHKEPPLDTCHEEGHFWNFMESDESFHFNLKCSKCGSLVKLDELVGLMMCTGCDARCEVDILRRKLEPEHARICIALGRRPIEERKRLAPEKFAVLQDFFNQRCNSVEFCIKLVPHEMLEEIADCYAEVIKDEEMLLAIAAGDK